MFNLIQLPEPCRGTELFHIPISEPRLTEITNREREENNLNSPTLSLFFDSLMVSETGHFKARDDSIFLKLTSFDLHNLYITSTYSIFVLFVWLSLYFYRLLLLILLVASKESASPFLYANLSYLSTLNCHANNKGVL